MTLWLWAAFSGLLLALLAADLGFVTRLPRAISPREALLSTMIWILAAFGMGVLIYHVYQTNFLGLVDAVSRPVDRVPLTGRAAMLQFIAGYFIETALSMDNIAVLVLLLSYFRIRAEHLARVLLWAVVLALAFRFAIITLGSHLLGLYPWFSWVLGSVLVLMMFRALFMPDEHTDFDRRWSVRVARRLLPITDGPRGQLLLVREPDGAGRPVLKMTPLLLAVIVAAMADVAYAADSIPAVFSVTRDPFIAFSSNALAILSLRSLYLTLVNVVGRFRFLKVSIVFVLLSLSAKMFLATYTLHATWITLGAVGASMILGVGASIAWHRFRAPVPAAPLSSIEPRPSALADLAGGVDATRRNIRKIVILIVGTFVVLVGALVVGPIPGPGGTIVVAFGLGILATEFIWAQRLLNTLKVQTQALAQRADNVASATPLWLVPIVIAGYVGASLAIARYLHHHFHASRVMVLVVAASMFLPVGYWAFRTIAGRRTQPPTTNPPTSAHAQPPPTEQASSPPPVGR